LFVVLKLVFMFVEGGWSRHWISSIGLQQEG